MTRTGSLRCQLPQLVEKSRDHRVKNCQKPETILIGRNKIKGDASNSPSIRLSFSLYLQIWSR